MSNARAAYPVCFLTGGVGVFAGGKFTAMPAAPRRRRPVQKMGGVGVSSLGKFTSRPGHLAGNRRHLARTGDQCRLRNHV